MFNIIQHIFNTTFNTVNHANTLIPAKLTISTVPTITTIILLLLFIIILISSKRKRGYITTTINHVFKCYLQHFAKRIINMHVNILQTSFEVIDKKPLSVYNNKRTRYIFSFKISFLSNIIKFGGVYMGAEKSKNIGFVLYPCNVYHTMFLDFLKNNYDGYYIKHEAGADNFQLPFAGAVAEQHDEKEHLHVVVMLPYARTANGFLKSLPNVRYYKPLQLENINHEIKQQLFTVFDVSCLDIPLEEVIQPIVAHCEVIHDIFAYSTYVLHKDIKSKFLGKKEYNFNDVQPLHCTIERIQDYFKMTDDSDSDLLDICVQMWSRCDGNVDMFMQLISMHSNKLVKYVERHAYFINTFIINRKEVFIDG